MVTFCTQLSMQKKIRSKVENYNIFSLLKSSQQHEHVDLVFYNRFQTKSQFHPKFEMMPAETKNFVFLLTLEQSWMDRSRSFSILHLSDWNQSRARVVACHKDHQVEKFNWCKEKNCQQWLNQMQFLIIDFIFDFQPFFERSSGVTLAFQYLPYWFTYANFGGNLICGNVKDLQ